MKSLNRPILGCDCKTVVVLPCAHWFFWLLGTPFQFIGVGLNRDSVIDKRGITYFVNNHVVCGLLAKFKGFGSSDIFSEYCNFSLH